MKRLFVVAAALSLSLAAVGIGGVAFSSPQAQESQLSQDGSPVVKDPKPAPIPTDPGDPPARPHSQK